MTDTLFKKMYYVSFETQDQLKALFDEVEDTARKLVDDPSIIIKARFTAKHWFTDNVRESLYDTSDMELMLYQIDAQPDEIDEGEYIPEVIVRVERYRNYSSTFSCTFDYHGRCTYYGDNIEGAEYAIYKTVEEAIAASYKRLTLGKFAD